MDSSLTLYLLRHGRSLADDEDKHEGRYDSPLTEVGQAQARRRGELWRADGLRFDQAIASPLQRARRTAEIVTSAVDAPLTFDPDWMEIDTGGLAGLTREEGARRFPLPAFRGPFTPTADVGESDWDLHARAIRALQRVVRRGPGRYLVVAHGGILNAALRVITGARPAVNLSTGVWFAFSDLGYAHLTYDLDADRWVLRELVFDE